MRRPQNLRRPQNRGRPSGRKILRKRVIPRHPPPRQERRTNMAAVRRGSRRYGMCRCRLRQPNCRTARTWLPASGQKSVLSWDFRMARGRGPMAKAKNRFEQVDELQPDAITLSLFKQDDVDYGDISCPSAVSGGRLPEDITSDKKPVQEAFRSAIRLANEVKAPIVVKDPGGTLAGRMGRSLSAGRLSAARARTHAPKNACRISCRICGRRSRQTRMLGRMRGPARHFRRLQKIRGPD